MEKTCKCGMIIPPAHKFCFECEQKEDWWTRYRAKTAARFAAAHLQGGSDRYIECGIEDADTLIAELRKGEET